MRTEQFVAGQVDGHGILERDRCCWERGRSKQRPYSRGGEDALFQDSSDYLLSTMSDRLQTMQIVNLMSQ